METVTLEVPTMWADHHTLIVHNLLAGMAGVSRVFASAKNREVSLSYDPGKIDLAAIEGTLAEAGYPVGAEEKAPEVGFVWRKAGRWLEIGDRATVTHQADLDMSGDYRLY